MKPSLLKLFIMIFRFLDYYIWNPIYWTIILSLLLGIGEIKAGLKKEIYLSPKKRIVGGVIYVVIGVVLFLYHYVYKKSLGVMV